MTTDERLREEDHTTDERLREEDHTTDERLREEDQTQFKLFRCMQCGFEYDEALGWPEDGIVPGTRWDDIPDDWSCPDCGAAKSDFEMVEIARS
jgi:rubredoxin